MVQPDGSSEHQRLVEACTHFGLPLNKAKILVAAAQVSLLGGHLDGQEGIYGLPFDKMWKVVVSTAVLSIVRYLPGKAVLHWAGVAEFAASFQWPLFQCIAAGVRTGHPAGQDIGGAAGRHRERDADLRAPHAIRLY